LLWSTSLVVPFEIILYQPIILKNSLLLVLVINSLITYAQLTPLSVKTDKSVIGFYEFKPSGYNADSTYNYPLLIFLHGIGERGNGTSELSMALKSSFAKILFNGATMKFVVNGRQYAFVVLIPQMSKVYKNWQNFYVDAMIGYARQNLKIDTNKIFITGWSLGGGGAWKYATASVENASKLAGIIPVGPAPDYTDICNLATGKVAVWAYHARDDASVPLHYTEDAITGINACRPAIPALITYYPFGGHPFVADHAYDTLNNTQYPNIFQWMIGTSRVNNVLNNQVPIANAGTDTIIILPSTKAALNGLGSYDPNDVIVQYRWFVLSGPVSPDLRIQKPGFPQTIVSGLEPGAYIFRLVVKDQFGITSSDEVNIKVMLPPGGANVPPVVNAGPDVTIRDDNYYLTGSGRDFDGRIKNYQWHQVSGPVSISVKGMGTCATVWGMYQEGTYGIELSAIDNHVPGGVGKDTVFITRISDIPVYYSYFDSKSSITSGEEMIRYGFIAVLFMLSAGQLLTNNGFKIKKLPGKNLNQA